MRFSAGSQFGVGVAQSYVIGNSSVATACITRRWRFYGRAGFNEANRLSIYIATSATRRRLTSSAIKLPGLLFNSGRYSQADIAPFRIGR